VQLKPVVSEKTLKLLKKEKTYVFKGLMSYTKKHVQEFLKEMYGSDIADIRMVRIKGKRKFNFTTRRYFVRKPYKKFYVKFKEDVKIPGFNIK